MTDETRSPDAINAETIVRLRLAANRLATHAAGLLSASVLHPVDAENAARCADAAARCFDVSRMYAPPDGEALIALRYAREIDACWETVANGNPAASAAAKSRLDVIRAIVAPRPGEEQA